MRPNRTMTTRSNAHFIVRSCSPFLWNIKVPTLSHDTIGWGNLRAPLNHSSSIFKRISFISSIPVMTMA